MMEFNMRFILKMAENESVFDYVFTGFASSLHSCVYVLFISMT